jgi:NAD(P)-dependent dehydrogenase (short-subunit alcohol dehydrogenase family)
MLEEGCPDREGRSRHGSQQWCRPGGEAYLVPIDVVRDEDVARLIGAALNRYGGLQRAVDNAGIELKVVWRRPRQTDRLLGALDRRMIRARRRRWGNTEKRWLIDGGFCQRIGSRSAPHSAQPAAKGVTRSPHRGQ